MSQSPHKYTYVTNNCGNISYFFKENRSYDHPIIGSLFVNDLQYARFCNKFDYYLNITPRFDLPDENSMWAKQNGRGWYRHPTIHPPYPVMYLDDIEIHWIHENSQEELIEKWNRRTERYKTLKPTPIFLLSSGDLCNDLDEETHKEMLKIFTSTPNSIYLTKNPKETSFSNVYVNESWIGSDNKRNNSHMPLIHTVGDRMIKYREIIDKLYYS